ncbi:hypothetical protein [Candidatus Lariskella endosymbiont of Hedychridium roseum]|uniref:hypothetical protein n=1 Tax=Candidatus Lariskella endosymbiont of Hedychridium roseum TaxID=3077949 RepID=UPI0030D43888
MKTLLSQNIDVVALMLLKRYMNTKELRDAIYNEATTHTIGIPDDLLELGIAAIREHHLHLIADILHIGFTGADRLLPHEIRESMLNDLNSREILEVIRITGEYFDAIDPLLVKINAEENINAELITTVLNAPSDRHLIQALHGIMQDPQTMSFLSQNLDVVA